MLATLQPDKIKRFIAALIYCAIVFRGEVTSHAGAQVVEKSAERQPGVISVEGNHILKDGAAWIPHGVVLIAFVAPPSAQKGVFLAAYRHYTPSEMSAIRDWGADTVRLQVSQPGLDPGGPLYSPPFVSEVRDAVFAARQAGLSVIVSIQDEHQSGELSPALLPNESTQRVWRELAPTYKDDLGVMFELLNEPQSKPSPQSWRAWAASMNATIATVRDAGARNVVIADGLQFAERLDGAPRLADPLNKVIYAVHPYAHSIVEQTTSYWDQQFGNFAKDHPVMVTEWTSTVPFYCDGRTPAAALDLLHYLNERNIGIVMFGFDFVAAKKFGSIVQDFGGMPTTYVDKQCGDEGYGPGTVVQEWYRQKTPAPETP